MVHDDIRHHFRHVGEIAHVLPVAEARIHLRVVRRVEARVGAINRRKEREHMHATEQPAQRAAQQGGEILETTAGEAVDVGNELDLVLHGYAFFCNTDAAGLFHPPWNCPTALLAARVGSPILQSFAFVVKTTVGVPHLPNSGTMDTQPANGGG